MLTTDQRSAATRLGYEAAGWNSEPKLEVSKEKEKGGEECKGEASLTLAGPSGPLGGLDALEGADAGRHRCSPLIMY